MNGLTVGGCKHQLQDATLVSQHGGIFHELLVEDEVLVVAEMLKKLKAKVFPGFVINKAAYHDYVYQVNLEMLVVFSSFLLSMFHYHMVLVYEMNIRFYFHVC